MKYLPATWSLPFLSALYFGACTNSGFGEIPRRLPQHEVDLRLAVCGFAASMFALIAGRQLRAFSEKGKSK